MSKKSDIRVYTLVKIKGETNLAVWLDDHWEIDDICETINSMLRNHLISEDVVLGWVTYHGGFYVN